MRKKLPVTLSVIVLLGCAGCAGLQQAPRPAQPAAEPAAQMQAPDTPEPAQAPVVVSPQQEPVAAEPGPRALAAPAAKKTGPRAGAAGSVPASTGEMISLNFDNADIYEVVNALSDFLGVNFIIDSRVKGRVNIHTAGEIEKSSLLPIVETIFEMNNIAMVEYGDFYKIVPIKDAKQQVVDFSIGRTLAHVPSYDRQMIQIVPLQYATAKDVEAMVKRVLGPGGDAFEYAKGNLVVIVERAAAIRKILGLINVVDVDVFAYNQVRFFKVSHANAKDIAAELEEIFTSIGVENTPEKGVGMKFIPVERVGGVLAVTSVPGAFERVEKMMEVLDTVDKDATEQVFIYFVENGKAEEIGDALNDVYLGGGGGMGMQGRRQDIQSRTRQDSGSGFGRQDSGSSFGQQNSRNSRTQQSSSSRDRQNSLSSRRSQQSAGRRGGQTSQGKDASTLLERDVSIVVDQPTNAIIVRAIPRDYDIIKRTMVLLDKVPRQVLIEVMIAEVTLGGDTEFGVEWALLSDGSIGGYDGKELVGVKNSRLRNDIPLPPEGDFTEVLPKGFAYLFSSDELKVFIQAQASENRLNILSSPHILAVDNREARIEVGEEVPLVSSEYVPLDADIGTQTSRNIEYRATGVILSVIPRINERGLVAMDINQEVSKAKINLTSGVDSPIITNRKAETSLVVQDGQTIVIGGLIGDQSGESNSGVPLLSKIPLLSYLFGTTKSDNSRTELLILLTPHGVTNFEEVDLVTKEINDKMADIKRLVNRSGPSWDAYKTKE